MLGLGYFLFTELKLVDMKGSEAAEVLGKASQTLYAQI
jgi:hypothetical protein